MLCAVACVVCLGCGQPAGEPTFPVTGVVTQTGEPLAGATVSFVPAPGGQGAVGTTDASGRYSLTTRVKDDGAIAGQYRVTITKYEGAEDTTAAAPGGPQVEDYPEDYDEFAAQLAPAPVSENVLPANYADPASSGFTATVTEGDNNFDFDLSD